jgi:hypothetical protein
MAAASEAIDEVAESILQIEAGEGGQGVRRRFAVPQR